MDGYPRSTRRSLARAALGVVMLAGLATAGYGGQAVAAPQQATQQITIIGNGHMHFKPASVTVHPGTVVVTLKVKGAEAHNIAFHALRVASPVIHRGQTTSITIHVAANHSYQYDCDLHINEGMVGTLHVSST